MKLIYKYKIFNLWCHRCNNNYICDSHFFVTIICTDQCRKKSCIISSRMHMNFFSQNLPRTFSTRNVLFFSFSCRHRNGRVHIRKEHNYFPDRIKEERERARERETLLSIREPFHSRWRGISRGKASYTGCSRYLIPRSSLIRRHEGSHKGGNKYHPMIISDPCDMGHTSLRKARRSAIIRRRVSRIIHDV